MSTTTLPHQETIAELLKPLEIETTVLFDHLMLEFLFEFPVFGPIRGGEHGCLSRLNCFGGLLHCYYNDIYAPEAMV